MKIKSISLENFKCHKKIDKMPFNDFTVLIGENDCGKTTIIDFLELMLTNGPLKDDFFHKYINEYGEEEITSEILGEIIFELEPSDIHRYKDFINDENEIRLKRTFSKKGNHIYLCKNKFKDDRLNDYKSFKAPELTKLVENLGLGPLKNQDDRKKAVESYIEENRNTISMICGWVEVSFLEVNNILPKFIRYSSDDYQNPTRMIFNVLQEVFTDELYQKNEDGTKEFKDANLKKVIDNIREKLIESTQRFKDHIQVFNNKVERITIDPNIDLSTGLKHTPIFVTQKNGLSNIIDAEGSGTRKRLFMAIFEWEKEVVQNINYGYAIRCYDEPDNNLHIEAQRQLFRVIKTIYQKTNKMNQILVCTHSLFMVDAAPAKSINLIKKDEDGNTEIEYLCSYGDKDVQYFIDNMCREMGLSNSHIFFEKCFLLVEGETEMSFLPTVYQALYNSTMAEDGISLINLHGNGSAVDYLKLLIKNKKDLIVLFFDNDFIKELENKLLKSSSRLFGDTTEKEYKQFIKDFWDDKVIFIGEKEFEDSFEDEVIAQALNKHISKEIWKGKDIAAIRKPDTKFSDKIISLVAKYCEKQQMKRYLKKPELGKLLADMIKKGEIDKNEIPEIVIELFKKVRKIAGVSGFDDINDDNLNFVSSEESILKVVENIESTQALNSKNKVETE